MAFNPRKNPRCDKKKREEKFLFFCHFLLVESRLPAVSEWGCACVGGVVVPAFHRVVAITRNEMQGGMHDGRLFRAGLTKCAASSFLFLFFFPPSFLLSDASRLLPQPAWET